MAIIGSLALVTVFGTLTWLSKEMPVLNLRQPWQDDPYDVVISLDFVILPLLVATGAWRVQMCRRFVALPARRLVDLLRLCGAAVGVCLATEAVEWVAVALGKHRATWTAATTWQIAALSVLTVATIGAGVLQGRAIRVVNGVARASAQPDWLTDAVTFGLIVSGLLGRHRVRTQVVVRWIDTRLIVRVRRRPVAAAALLACVLALPYVVAKIVLEGYPPALVLLSFALPAGTLFAFVVIVGRYLRIVAPRQAAAPPWLLATVTACVAGAVVFAFHDSLLTHQTAAGLNVLLFGGAVAGGALSLIAQLAFRFRRTHKSLG